MLSFDVVFRTYLVKLAAGTVGAACMIVAFLFVVDPYGIYPDVEGISPTASTDLFFYLRLHKPYALENIRADHLIIGSSRAARLNPAKLDASGGVAYNASLPGISLFEMFRTLEHADVIKPLTSVLLELDYYMFRAGHVTDSHEDHRLSRSNPTTLQTLRHWNQRWHDRWRSLFSFDALLLTYQAATLGGIGKRRFFDDGTWQTTLPESWESRRYKLQAQQKFKEFDEMTAELDMSRLVDILDYGEAHEIELTFLLSPNHAVQLSTIRIAGQWDSYLRWQRETIATIDRHSSSVVVFGLEDNPHFITEPLDSEQAFFEDGVHYTRWAGDLILSCVKARARACSSDLEMTPLDADNINVYLRSITEVMENYPDTHPKGYAALQTWLDQD